MNVEITGKRVFVTLSKRNLLALLQKVSLPLGESACTIQRLTHSGDLVIVQAEPDAIHYGEREPGAMRDDTEAFIAEHANVS